ncbi:serpin family protein [Actinotalea fermentans]|uniref:serpin family protein n=1 Tax=Actinotalea fermentans TaxID=43671 RepID=UPI0011BE9104|nr:serpin family protein [Actinotalea fermentans]
MHGTRNTAAGRTARPATARAALAVVTTTAVLAAGGCAGGDSDLPAPLAADARFVGVADDARPEQPMVDASVRLATELLDVAPAGEDAVVSPLSLQLALALLREGATGTPAAEIDAAAGLPGSQAVADLRALLAQYEGDVAGIDPDEPPEVPLLHVADSAFVQQDFGVVPAFLERVAAYHDAEVYEVDFRTGDPKPALDAWVAEETGGLLTECPAPTTPQTRVVLMDAVTFGATWASPFAAENTADGPFTRADGTSVQVPLMHQTTVVPYAEGDGWVAVELPYTEGFAMRLVLPDAGALAADAWAQAHAALSRASGTEVLLTLPSWTTDTTLALTEALAELGLGSLREPDGDLDGVFPDAFVSAIAQGATITVAEKGTVAAAVTAISLDAGAAPTQPLEVRFDRPFEYQVVHSGTGLVLFAGRVADPSDAED